VLLLSLSLSAFAADSIVPEQIPEAETWDLTHLYPTVEAWSAAMEDAGTRVDALADCEGRLADRAALKDCLDRRFAVLQTLNRLGSYTGNHQSEDNGDDTWGGRNQQVEILFSRFAEVTAFFGSELVAVGEKKLDKALAKDPSLAPYAYFIDVTLRDAAHILPPEQEALLARVGLVSGAANRAYRTLKDAELPYPTVTLSDGTEVRLAAPAFAHYRGSPVRADRKLVFDAYMGALGTYKGTFATNLDATVQAHWMEAEARGYGSSVEAALAGDHIPPTVYDALVRETNNNLPTLHRYLRLRAKMLGITDLTYPDVYAPLVERDGSYDLATAKELATVSAAPLGPEYQAVLQKGFAERWMDVWPRDGKSPGAYMNGSAYAVHPYVLLNYTGDWDSVSTLAHEWGHAAHSALSTAAQPYPTSDYATFIAEVASTFAEALLMDHVLTTAKTDDERLFYLGHALEQLRGTWFRQAQFAEFERAVHVMAERGEPITGDSLSKLYLDIERRYYGHDAGVTIVDEAYGVEWAYVPHFYYNFYVYQYATSIAASSLLAERVVKGEEGAVDRYLTLLRAGGSDHPYELLKTAGVDMATGAPYDAMARRMNAIMDEMEAILAKRPTP
jgi:oligoendopeptidase F